MVAAMATATTTTQQLRQFGYDSGGARARRRSASLARSSMASDDGDKDVLLLFQ
jgi:hypothetical protein